MKNKSLRALLLAACWLRPALHPVLRMCRIRKRQAACAWRSRRLPPYSAKGKGIDIEIGKSLRDAWAWSPR